MTNVHQVDAPCVRLDAIARAIVEAQALRDTFRALLGAELHTCSVGWPLRGRPRAAAALAIELASEHAHSPFELALMVPFESAARWVDRTLGGHADSGIASASGALSEAECGVLAYLAARVCKAVGSALHVRNVGPLPELTASCVTWPIAIDSELGQSSLQCVFAPQRVDAMVAQYPLRASVFEPMDDVPLAPGEVWIGEHTSLSSTSDGVVGEVSLAVEGCATVLRAFAGQGLVRASGEARERDATDHVELVLATRPTCFGELSSLGAGDALSLAIDPSRVELRRRGETIAHAELVSWRGAIGVRILAR